MIDTIRVEVHDLEPWQIEAVRLRLEGRLIVDAGTGAVKSEFFTGQMVASWDYRISVSIRNRSYICYRSEPGKKQIGSLVLDDYCQQTITPVAVQVPDFLVIEFSLAKWAECCNFLNCGPVQDALRLSVFRRWLGGVFGFDLPPLENWKVRRLDISMCYDLHSQVNCYEYLQTLKNLDFPRRKKPEFRHNSIYSAGSTTTVKGYCKHNEFKVHDYKRIVRYTRDKDLSKALLMLTVGLFRVEIEVKFRKLAALGIETIEHLFTIDWVNFMKNEYLKLIAGSKIGRPLAQIEVAERLKNSEIKGKGVTAETCLAVWQMIVLEGQKTARNHFGKMKYSRVIRTLEELGIPALGLIEEKKTSSLFSEPNLFLAYSSDDKQRRQAFYAIYPMEAAA